MNRSLKVVTGVALLAGAGLLFTGFPFPASAAPASAQDAYLDKCSVCHGQDGAGNKMSEAEMIDIVAKGKGKEMDGYAKELGDDMVKQLVEYYRSLAKS